MSTSLSSNFYTRKLPFSSFDIGIVKWSAASLGLAVGSYFPEIFRPYFGVLLLLALITGVWGTIIWLKAIKASS